jgi:hypothetical protein
MFLIPILAIASLLVWSIARKRSTTGQFGSGKSINSAYGTADASVRMRGTGPPIRQFSSVTSQKRDTASLLWRASPPLSARPLELGFGRKWGSEDFEATDIEWEDNVEEGFEDLDEFEVVQEET